MLLQNLRAKVGARLNGDKEAGFTLIELLVVMLILGILAAIALPAFFNQKDKAGDAKAKEYVHSAQVAMETYGTENGGKYPNPGADVANWPAKLKEIEPTLSGAEGLAAAATDGDTLPAEAAKGYTISVTGTSGSFTVTRNADTGALTYTCSAPGKGGCPPGAGDWSK
jgi:type IV pilus assembly protein PilA